MPKKHQPSYRSIKPASTAQSPRINSSAALPPQSSSVNDRIQQLRREQAPRPTAERRDEITEVVTQRTVPPHLRRLLQLAEVDAPKPKAGSRSRTSVRVGQRPPPGPAAPSSWLQRSRWAQRTIVREREIDRGRLSKLAIAHDAEFKRLPSQRSLVHQCLRIFASHWEELIDYEQHYVSSLPIGLKEALLAYLSLYRHRGCLDLRSLKILFSGDQDGIGASGAEDVSFLDLTGLLSNDFTLKELGRSLQRPVPAVGVTSEIARLQLASTKGKEKNPIDIAESWEDAATNLEPLPIISNTPIFSNLTRLSLGRPGAAASWTDLLAISVHLHTLTHLSLADWPRPSTTPNAATTAMVSQHGSVHLGGSHYYSDLDDDWHEAANILRRLSLNTYCLQWLDLEGCTWLKALTWEMDYYTMPSSESFAPARRPSAGPGVDEDWNGRSNRYSATSLPGPDWNGAWRQITYVNFSQGWIPRNVLDVKTVHLGPCEAPLENWMHRHGHEEAYQHMLIESSLGQVQKWLAQEDAAWRVKRKIEACRNRAKGHWCVVDHGWE